jgi:dTDP-4-dehydrorhamnose reductase
MPADVLVLGVSGMFGQAAFNVMRQKYDVLATARRGGGDVVEFDVLQSDADLEALTRRLRPGGVVVNAVAVLAADINAAVAAADRERALLVNAVFPHRLARIASALGQRVVQISTDAVFPHDADTVTEADRIGPEDAYGHSKAAGELSDPHCLTIRCSIIGPPAARHRRGLWAWVADQPPNATISGYVNQVWSGLTTLQLAETCACLVEHQRFAEARAHGAIHHLAPNPAISKFDLVRALSRLLRPDLKVEPANASQTIRRMLKSRYSVLDRMVPRYPDWNAALAAAA